MIRASKCLAPLAFVALAACGRSEPPPRAEPTFAHVDDDKRLGDGHALEVVKQATNATIREGKLAQERASFAKVRALAERAVRDHGEANAKVDRASHGAELAPRTSETSNALDAEGKQETLDIEGKRGDDFDRAYLTTLIRRHESTLSTIDKKLLPTARAPEVVNLLREYRAQVVQELADAKTLYGRMGNE